jgi:hypothetical protein
MLISDGEMEDEEEEDEEKEEGKTTGKIERPSTSVSSIRD